MQSTYLGPCFPAVDYVEMGFYWEMLNFYRTSFIISIFLWNVTEIMHISISWMFMCQTAELITVASFFCIKQTVMEIALLCGVVFNHFKSFLQQPATSLCMSPIAMVTPTHTGNSRHLPIIDECTWQDQELRTEEMFSLCGVGEGSVCENVIAKPL